MKFKKFIALFLALTISLGIAVPSSAETDGEDMIAPCFTYISSALATVGVVGQNSVEMSSIVHVYDEYTIVIDLHLQKATSSDSLSWGLHGSVHSHTVTDEYAHVYDTTDNVPGGYYYRTYAYVKIYDGTKLVESTRIYSKSVYVP